jgi:hypothetical protein
MSIQHIIDRMTAELAQQDDLRRIAMRQAEDCPLALAIAQRNRDATRNMPGFSYLADRRTYKAMAAEAILDMRRNRVALMMMGKDPHAADLRFLRRAAAYREMASGKQPLPELHTRSW